MMGNFDIVEEIISRLTLKFISDCPTEYGKKRTRNLFTYDRWNENDSFMNLSDKFCYSFIEMGSMHERQIKFSPYTRSLFDKNDFKKMEIVQGLLHFIKSDSNNAVK